MQKLKKRKTKAGVLCSQYGSRLYVFRFEDVLSKCPLVEHTLENAGIVLLRAYEPPELSSLGRRLRYDPV